MVVERLVVSSEIVTVCGRSLGCQM
jgi:hypothetical protein